MGSGKKSNGKRRVSKADGTKKRAKKAMRKSRRVDSLEMLRKELQKGPNYPPSSPEMQAGFNPFPQGMEALRAEPAYKPMSIPRPYGFWDVLKRAFHLWFCE